VVPTTVPPAPEVDAAPASAVFVDASGGRRRRARVVMGLVAAACLGFLVLLALGLTGAGPLSGNVVITPLRDALTDLEGGTPSASTAAARPTMPASGGPSAAAATPTTTVATAQGRGAAGPSAPSAKAPATPSPHPTPRPSTSPSVGPTPRPTPTPTATTPSPTKPGQGANHRATNKPTAKPTHTPHPGKP
jgi:hypothetical protein